MSDWQPTAYEDHGWIVADPQLLGGKLAICGTRLSVSWCTKRQLYPTRSTPRYHGKSPSGGAGLPRG
jgi:hypothetical protein